MGNFDGGWKLGVTRFFPLFMDLLFRNAYDQINWKRGFVALDKELEALFPRGKSGRKHVDLLFKVWLNDGSEQWVLIHIEIQSQRVEDFERVMYEYNYRVYDRYKHPVASFAVLADEHPSWRPAGSSATCWAASRSWSFRRPSCSILAMHCWRAIIIPSRS